MKYSARILLLLIAAAIVVMIVNQRTSVNDTEPSTQNVDETNQIVSQSNERCYAQKEAFKTGEENTTLYGYSFLRATINNDQVMGTYENYPAEKDAMYGTFIGKVNRDDMGSTFLTTSYSYAAEGMENTEEKYFILSDDLVYIGYGQMADDGEGMYRYEDPTMIDFSYTIPKVSCEKYEEVYSDFSEMNR